MKYSIDKLFDTLLIVDTVLIVCILLALPFALYEIDPQLCGLFFLAAFFVMLFLTFLESIGS